MAAARDDAFARRRLLKPFVRAYIFGLLSSVAPRSVALLASLLRRKCSVDAFITELWQAVQQATAINQFPAFCGLLVGGSTLLQAPLKSLVSALGRQQRHGGWHIGSESTVRMARFLAALVAATVSFGLINGSTRSQASDRRSTASVPLQQLPEGTPGGPLSQPNKTSFDASALPPLPPDAVELQSIPPSSIPLAGKTIDLTLFAVFRALDIIYVTVRRPRWRRARAFRLVDTASVPVLFALSSSMIMHAWFYSPTRLPRSYCDWISRAASLDERLLAVLRHARYGNFVYGRDTGMASLLGSMCKDYDLPEEWGDPAVTVPVPCELVHMGCGPSCEKHALARFWRGFLFAAKMHVPFQTFVFVKRACGRTSEAGRMQLLRKALVSAARSSSFLGAFIALFYYGVCLSRTRLGPRMFSSKTVTPQMWDSGLCVLAGCAICGFGVLAEEARRRLEILFFVLPRAAAVWFPRRYLREHRWREHLAFAVSTAVVFTAAQERPERVRGVLGRALQEVFK